MKIPPNWTVSKAEIRYNNKLIYNGLSSPLGVPVLSNSFKGKIKWNTLKNNLFYDNKIKNAVVYNWKALYRQNNDWGFCIPKNIYDKIKNYKSYFDIEIKTKTKKSNMKVLDFHIKGRSKKTILFNAHNCHPFQANDDISGCAVGIALFKYLKEKKNLRYSYRLLICPELIGTMFWIDKIYKQNKDIVAAILLKSVGNKRNLKLQKSFDGNTELDKIAKKVFDEKYEKYNSGPFRTIYGNDETVFESPGFKIPTISLTRFPFKEYHTDLDKPNKLSESQLVDTLDTCKKIIWCFENNYSYKVNFKGLISLSNPKYNLYKKTLSVGIHNKKVDINSNDIKWNLLMNNLPMELENGNDIIYLSNKYNLPFEDVLFYLSKWEEKKLIKRNHDYR